MPVTTCSLHRLSHHHNSVISGGGSSVRLLEVIIMEESTYMFQWWYCSLRQKWKGGIIMRRRVHTVHWSALYSDIGNCFIAILQGYSSNIFTWSCVSILWAMGPVMRWVGVKKGGGAENTTSRLMINDYADEDQDDRWLCWWVGGSQINVMMMNDDIDEMDQSSGITKMMTLIMNVMIKTIRNYRVLSVPCLTLHFIFSWNLEDGANEI